MIQLSGAGKRFGHKLLFENVDWLITNHDHIGLVGGNGTGKSTLMKILAGMDTFDYGSLIVAKGTSAGYLPQDGLTLSGRTVFAECMSVFDDVRAMEQELESLMHSMAEIDHTSTTPISGDNVIQVEPGGNWDDRQHVVIPFTKFWVTEKSAPEAEKAYLENSRRDKVNAYVTVRVRNGDAALEQLYIDNQPLPEFLRARAAKK